MELHDQTAAAHELVAVIVLDGLSSRSNSTRFCPSSAVIKKMPVALPPGRLKLATSPSATGSKPTTNTIGTVVVTAFAGEATCGPAAEMIKTGRGASWPASAASRSY